MENRRMQLKQHLTHSPGMYQPHTQPASLWPEWVFWKKKKDKKAKWDLKRALDWEPDNFISAVPEKEVVTACAGDANLCLPYQHVRRKGRLIIHKVSGWARQVNHSSACVFVTIEMEIDVPETFRFIYTDRAYGAQWVINFSNEVAHVWHVIPLHANFTW